MVVMKINITNLVIIFIKRKWFFDCYLRSRLSIQSTCIRGYIFIQRTTTDESNDPHTHTHTMHMYIIYINTC